MLDRHAVQKLVRAQVTAREIAQQFKISIRTVRRIVRESAVESGDDVAGRAARGIGRPGVTEAIRTRVRALLGDDPALPPGEVWRLLREDGTPLGLSTVYRVVSDVRPTIPTAPMVRFEGVAGEFYGKCRVMVRTSEEPDGDTGSSLWIVSADST
jgi:transposase